MLRDAAKRLQAVSDQPRMEAEILFGHVLGLSRAGLIAADSECIEWPAGIEPLLQRRERGEPLSYLTGSQGFWTFDVHVSPAVLIPRPDTETLVEAAIDRLRTAEKTAGEVLDLGTGSGCIALALASEFSEVNVIATDLSGSSLEIARANAARLKLDRVHFVQGDWFDALARSPVPRFALIVSNPPYVAEDDPHLEGLRHEPRGALVSGADGLDALRRIISQAPSWLMPRGWLMVEHGFDQGDAVRTLFDRAGFSEISTRCDLGKRERVTQGRWS